MARPRKPPRLKQRGRIWYIYDGDEIPFSTRTAILSEAEAHLAQYVAALDSPISPREPTVCDLIDAFEQGRWEKAKNRAANAAEKNANACGIESAEEIARLRELAAAGITKMDAIGNDTYAFQALKIHLGPLLVSQINSGTARQYERDRRAARRNLAAAAKSASSRIPGGGFLAESTIARDLKRLRAALSWAAAEDVRGWFGQSERIPTFEMSVGVTSLPRIRFLETKEQALRLINAAHLPHVRLFIRIALATGARKEAIEQLPWSAVLWDWNIIDFGAVEHRKTRPHIQMTPDLGAALWAAYQVRCSDWVIEYQGDRAGNIKNGLKKAAEKADLPWVTSHVFKHTVVTWLAQAGKSVEYIAGVVNTKPDTLRRYYRHLFGPLDDEHVQALALETATTSQHSRISLSDDDDSETLSLADALRAASTLRRQRPQPRA